MNTNQTKLQRIESELAEIKARIASRNVPVAIAKPKSARKPRVKIAKSDQKFKNRIIAYMKDSSERLASYWIEGDQSRDGFYEYFRNDHISEKLAILEIAFPDNPEKIQEYLDYVPE
jgi:hypothetical protein